MRGVSAPVTGRTSIRLYPIRLDWLGYRELCFSRYRCSKDTGTAVREIIEERSGIEVGLFPRTQTENVAVCKRVRDQRHDHSKALTKDVFGHVRQSRLDQRENALQRCAVFAAPQGEKVKLGMPHALYREADIVTAAFALFDLFDDRQKDGLYEYTHVTDLPRIGNFIQLLQSPAVNTFHAMVERNGNQGCLGAEMIVRRG